MTGQFILPGWVVNHPQFTDDNRAEAERIAKDFAIRNAHSWGYDGPPYEGHVEWIEHKPDPSWGSGAGSVWEVRAR